MWKALRSGYGETERSQALRLKAVVAEHGIKVSFSILSGGPDALSDSAAITLTAPDQQLLVTDSAAQCCPFCEVHLN